MLVFDFIVYRKAYPVIRIIVFLSQRGSKLAWCFAFFTLRFQIEIKYESLGRPGPTSAHDGNQLEVTSPIKSLDFLLPPRYWQNQCLCSGSVFS